jgi:hypothetical protein
MTCRSGKSTAPARTGLPAYQGILAEDLVSITLRKRAVLVRSQVYQRRRSAWRKPRARLEAEVHASATPWAGLPGGGARPGSQRSGEVAPLALATGRKQDRARRPRSKRAPPHPWSLVQRGVGRAPAAVGTQPRHGHVVGAGDPTPANPNIDRPVPRSIVDRSGGSIAGSHAANEPPPPSGPTQTDDPSVWTSRPTEIEAVHRLGAFRR